MSDTIIWITGATEGIGLALAQNQPFAGARIINLSRVASRPAGANLLLSELDDALAAEPLASWLPLRTLRAIVQTGGSRIIPFGTERHLR